MVRQVSVAFALMLGNPGPHFIVPGFCGGHVDPLRPALSQGECPARLAGTRSAQHQMNPWRALGHAHSPLNPCVAAFPIRKGSIVAAHGMGRPLWARAD